MTTHRLLRYSTTWRYKAFNYLQETLVHETTTCCLPQYSTQAKTRSQEELFIHKMETSKEARSLHPHKVIAQEKLSQKGQQFTIKKSYLHDKEKTQYILLFYQLYNLVSYKLSLLYILDESVMITSWTHAIAKNGYLRGRLVWLNKPKSLRHTVFRSLSQVLGKLLRNHP